jgi:hypothetical protein
MTLQLLVADWALVLVTEVEDSLRCRVVVGGGCSFADFVAVNDRGRVIPVDPVVFVDADESLR